MKEAFEPAISGPANINDGNINANKMTANRAGAGSNAGGSNKTGIARSPSVNSPSRLGNSPSKSNLRKSSSSGRLGVRDSTNSVVGGGRRSLLSVGDLATGRTVSATGSRG